MRAIDADALKTDIVTEGQRSRRYKLGEIWELNRAEIYKVIDEQPTIDPERKRGQWINIRNDNVAECDQCEITGRAWMNFCPICGADMRNAGEIARDIVHEAIDHSVWSDTVNVEEMHRVVDDKYAEGWGGKLRLIYVKYKKLTDTAMVPTRGSARAAGYDLYADTSTDIMMFPGEVVEFFTGLALEIPDGYFGAVYPRSGLATKLGLRLPNCVGVIDSDFRGNVGIPLRNDSRQPVTVKAHERVAQIIIQPCPDIVLSEAQELSETGRGTAGFGSTGRT